MSSRKLAKNVTEKLAHRNDATFSAHSV